jgi:hypothetical protein
MRICSDEIAALRDAQSTLDEARRCYADAVREAFPVGSNIHSGKSGRGIVACTVLRHGGDDRLFIRSQTGREYWITAYHVVEAGINPDLN